MRPSVLFETFYNKKDTNWYNFYINLQISLRALLKPFEHPSKSQKCVLIPEWMNIWFRNALLTKNLLLHKWHAKLLIPVCLKLRQIIINFIKKYFKSNLPDQMLLKIVSVGKLSAAFWAKMFFRCRISNKLQCLHRFSFGDLFPPITSQFIWPDSFVP